jgi:hypothetical protein
LLQRKFNADGSAKLPFLSTFARIAGDVTLSFWLSVTIETGLVVVQRQHETEGVAAVRDFPLEL